MNENNVPAGTLPASLLALRAEALEIFDGPETSQDVRDAIEWYASSIGVLVSRARAKIDAALAKPPSPMDDAIAAGDGTLHGAIDYWQARALAAEAARDVDETNKVLADNYLTLTAQPAAEPLQQAILTAISSCGHSIDAESVTLYFDPKQPGHNALNQLSRRITAALAKPPAAPVVAQQEAEAVAQAVVGEASETLDVCSKCGLAGRAIADERDAYATSQSHWKALAESLMGIVGEISDALGIDAESQQTANGAEEILDRIAELKSADPVARVPLSDEQLLAVYRKHYPDPVYMVGEERGHIAVLACLRNVERAAHGIEASTGEQS